MIAALAMPPARYDHAPDCEPTIERVSAADMQMASALAHIDDGDLLLGATFAGCVVWVRDDLTDAAEARVLRHERGHLNGWVHG